MGSFDRLERIARSWTGSFRRNEMYHSPDILMMLTELGMQMRPETLAWLCDNAVAKEEIEQSLYAAEAQFGKKILLDDCSIDPVFEPRVVEEDNQVGIILKWKGKDFLLCQFSRN